MKIQTTKIIIAILVAVHLVGNLWHGSAHAILEIALPDYKTAFVLVVIIISPVLGAILCWTKFSIQGCWLVALSMLGSLLFSVYHHFVMISIDNVDHLPPGTPAAHKHFANSAEFIALAALAAALFSFYALGRQSEEKRGH